jgi:hypothetical protein
MGDVESRVARAARVGSLTGIVGTLSLLSDMKHTHGMPEKAAG